MSELTQHEGVGAEAASRARRRRRQSAPCATRSFREAAGSVRPRARSTIPAGSASSLTSRTASSHAIVEMGLQILLNLDHRGAVGADPKAGDGCGMLVQIPHRFFAEECAGLGIVLPRRGGMPSAPVLPS